MRLSECGSVVYPVERRPKETQAEQYSDTGPIGGRFGYFQLIPLVGGGEMGKSLSHVVRCQVLRGAMVYPRRVWGGLGRAIQWEGKTGTIWQSRVCHEK